MAALSATRTSPAATTAPVVAALIGTVGLAALAWLVAVRSMNQMNQMTMPGMDTGLATRLGPFGPFAVAWVVMMAAMMLPGAAPAAVMRARASGRVGAVLAFVGAYLGVWALVGIIGYAVDHPHGPAVAGAVVVLAGLYELTARKRRFRQRCGETVHSGLRFGLYCVGSSGGLMLVPIALGLTNLGWMAAVTVVAALQKLRPAHGAIDVPVGLAIVGLGFVVLFAPAAVPGLMPAVVGMQHIHG